MPLLPVIALSLLLTPVADETCQPTGNYLPEINVIAERNDPNFSHDQSTSGLTVKSANAYKPPGVGGPAWHAGGLTQTQTTISYNTEMETITIGAEACIRIKSIGVKIVLTPQVWVANNFTPGSCMYNAVREHELKHVNANRRVTNIYLGRIRAALTDLANGRSFFGPGPLGDVKARFQIFADQEKEIMNAEMANFKEDERKAQEAVDTMQEYRRVSNLCPQQQQR